MRTMLLRPNRGRHQRHILVGVLIAVAMPLTGIASSGCIKSSDDDEGASNASAQTMMAPDGGSQAPPTPPTAPPRDPELDALLKQVDELLKQSALDEAERKKKAAADEKKKFEDDQKAIDERLSKNRVKLLELARKLLTLERVSKLDEELEAAIESGKTAAIDSAVRKILDEMRAALARSEDLAKAQELMKEIADTEKRIQKARDEREFQLKMLRDFPDEGSGSAQGGIILADMLGLSREKDDEIKLTVLKSKLRELLGNYNPNVIEFNRVQDDIAETIRRQRVHDELQLLKNQVDLLLEKAQTIVDKKARDETIAELERIKRMIMDELGWNRMTPADRAEIEKRIAEIKKAEDAGK